MSGELAENIENGLPWFLAILALLSALRSLYIYARDGRYANIDRRGHALNFHFRWLMAALLAGFAVGSYPLVHWAWGLGTGVAFYCTAFVIPRIIARAMTPFGWHSVQQSGQNASQNRPDRAAKDG